MENFYRPQARHYDIFRKRLLHGRESLFGRIPAPDGGVWVDIGGGSGANLEAIGESIARLSRVYIVDLSPSLLAVARERAERHKWRNVQTVLADGCEFVPEEGQADVVTFSYSLTMIPDWFAAIDHAHDMLRPGGVLGAVDFYVARKHPADLRRHRWRTRSFWPVWFGLDNVFPSADHLPYLRRRFETLLLEEHRAPVPYLPLVRAPYYLFLGKKRQAARASSALMPDALHR